MKQNFFTYFQIIDTRTDRPVLFGTTTDYNTKEKINSFAGDPLKDFNIYYNSSHERNWVYDRYKWLFM